MAHVDLSGEMEDDVGPLRVEDIRNCPGIPHIGFEQRGVVLKRVLQVRPFSG
jgi:hypothetical protein